MEHSWDNGHNSAGSMLTSADLSDNNVKLISDLSDHRFLEKLHLQRNEISCIQGLLNLKYLQVFCVYYASIFIFLVQFIVHNLCLL
jgi:Leucine-rich repeat (LRR) protein